MADELSIVVSVAFNKGGISTQRSESISVDVAGDAFTHQVQTMPDNNSALDVGTAVATQGYLFIKNLDADYYVDIGVSGSSSITLKPGEIALFRAKAAIYAEPESGHTVNVEYWVIEL